MHKVHFDILMLYCLLQASSTDERGGLIHSYHAAAARKKKRKFITITKNVLGEVGVSFLMKNFQYS